MIIVDRKVMVIAPPLLTLFTTLPSMISHEERLLSRKGECLGMLGQKHLSGTELPITCPVLFGNTNFTIFVDVA